MANTQITTGKVRISYAHLFTPYASNNNSTPKYSVTLLIPKTDKYTLDKIKSAQAAAKEKYLSAGGKTLPSNLKSTLHDGDGEMPNGGEYGPECKGCYVMAVSSNRKPVVVDANKIPITDPNEVYSGCYCRAIINFYVFENSGSKGLTAGLNGIMKIHDGDSLGGAVVTDSDWDDDWSDEDDMLLG